MKIKIKDPLHKSDNNDNINSDPVPTQPECCAVARCHAYHLLGQLLYSSTQLRPLFSLRKKTSLGYDARPKIWPHQYFISPTSNGGAARRPKNKYRLKELTSETVHYPLCRSVLFELSGGPQLHLRRLYALIQRALHRPVRLL